MLVKFVDTKCPNCGAYLNVDLDAGQANCQFCGAKLLIDDEVQRFAYVNAEAAGYDFEKGRQRAQREQVYTPPTPSPSFQEQPVKPKRKTWLWVLGWVFIFPVPLTILLLRNQSMDKRLRVALIAAAWPYIFLWVLLEKQRNQRAMLVKDAMMTFRSNKPSRTLRKLQRQRNKRSKTPAIVRILSQKKRVQRGIRRLKMTW